MVVQVVVEGMLDVVVDAETKAGEPMAHPRVAVYPRAVDREVLRSVEGATEPRAGAPSDAIGRQGTQWVHRKTSRRWIREVWLSGVGERR